MNIETMGFKNNRRNTIIPCGMANPPYSKSDVCNEYAVVSVTDMGWEQYTNYRIRAGKYRRNGRFQLPLMMRPLLCQKHLDYLTQLPDNPREVVME